MASSLGALLSRVVARLHCVQLCEYGCDILSIHETPEAEEPLPDQRIAAEECLATCARSAMSLMPVWLRLSPAEFAVLRGRPAGLVEVPSAWYIHGVSHPAGALRRARIASHVPVA